jgi:hypothetical protein
MEIFGGFMVMMSIISLFLAVVWLIMPFVVFAIKGKQDRTLEVLEDIDKRLAALEMRLGPAVSTSVLSPAEAPEPTALQTSNPADNGSSAAASPEATA